MLREEMNRRVWVVGITGASGMPYALRLVEVLSQHVDEVHIVFSEAGLRVLHEEQGLKLKSSRLTPEAIIGRSAKNIFFYDNKDIGAAIASGSFLTTGMVIVPCSMGTLGAMSSGICHNLITRAADVTLKERKQLVIVPRETPLSAIHLENLLKLSKLGVSIVPAMPGFYQQPETLSDLVDMMVMKILDQMGIHLRLVPRWGEDRENDEGSAVKPVVLKSLP
ncbi:MAG: UbiX family flavin prenyltransferase [Bdellovibrionales bacterium]|nr:UbiX family flavin prenyltransferase [Bdellovibrionales bacterium]